MNEQALILMAGLPRSGKSTRVAELLRKLPQAAVVCPDSIRQAMPGQPFIDKAEDFIWATAYVMARALFNSGHRVVIVDATNVIKARRVLWERRFIDKLVYVSVVDTPAEVCIERARAEGNEGLVGAIEAMDAIFDCRGLDDGEFYLADLVGRLTVSEIQDVVRRERAGEVVNA